jgi:hypothetical protein
LTFNTVTLIIPETLDKKEEIMKKVFLLLAVLLVVLPLSARSKVEFCPKGSVYLDGGVSFGVGADLTVNPKKNLGLRVNLGELVFGDIEGIGLNAPVTLTSPTKFDVLYYTNIGGLFSYVAFTCGFSSINDVDMIAIGGGLGLEKYMGKGNYLFFEPGLVYVDVGGADDVIFRLPFGIKIGI